MIVRKVWYWTRSTIQDAVETFAGAGGVRYAYFYPDRVVMTARPLRDNRGVQAVVTKDEVIDGDAVADVVRLIWAQMHGNLLFRLRALESEEAKA